MKETIRAHSDGAEIPEKYKVLSHNLSQHLKPVRPLRMMFLFQRWVFLCLSCGLMGIAYYHVRPEWAFQIRQIRFYAIFCMMAATCFFAAYGAFLSGIPGMGKRAVRYLFASTIIGTLWLLIYLLPIFASYLYRHPLQLDAGITCSLRVLSLSMIPLMALVYLLLKLTPTRAWLTGIAVFSIATLVGNMSMHFICPASDPIHILVWHMGPIVLMSSLGAILGRWLFRW